MLYNMGAVTIGFPMVINNHLAMHYPESFNYSPVPSWWLYSFERCNDSHADGAEMEVSLAQAWIQKHQVYKLVFNFPCLFLYLYLLNFHNTNR